MDYTVPDGPDFLKGSENAVFLIGQRVKAKVVKNKVAPPFQTAEFDMMHDSGISYEGDILDHALAQKIIIRSGAWFRYGDQPLGQGREKVRQFLRENPDFVEELREKVLENLQPATEEGVPDPEENSMPEFDGVDDDGADIKL